MITIAQRFPVLIPEGFTPSDKDRDGTDRRWDGKPCPCQGAPYKPLFGGGFRDLRGAAPNKKAHRALDIMAPEGAQVVSPCDGVIPVTVRMTLDGKMGDHPGAGSGIKAGNYTVVVNEGWSWYLAHMLDVPLVRPGDHVVAGQLLGYAGRSGNASIDKKTGKTGCTHVHTSLAATTPATIRKARSLRLDILGDKVDIVPILRPLWEAGGWRG